MSPKSRNRRGGKERPRRRLPAPRDDGGWGLQNSPYTIEGEIEGVQRFASGARHSRNARLGITVGLTLLLAGPAMVALLVLVERFVFR